jgi:uncharacterized protein (DUF58 family)
MQRFLPTRSNGAFLQRAAERSELWRYFSRTRPADAEPITLRHRRVFILPSLHGVTFGFALLLMLMGSINYSLGLGFVLTFLLAGLSIVGLVHTFRNLIRLKLSVGRLQPVFAGERAAFVLNVENDRTHPRFSIRARRGGETATTDVPARGWSALEVPAQAQHRGWLALGRVTIETRYPLGLFRAWSYIQPDARLLVYPHPETCPLPPERAVRSMGDAIELGAGSDDFVGLRGYLPGDSPRHIAWKTAARADDLITKQFTSRGHAELLLDWDALPANLDVESRLSHLAGWVLQAEATKRDYGLRIPARIIEPGCGPEHRDRCLAALALYGEPPVAE